MTDNWLCSGSDVIAKAGVHVNSALSGSSTVANFILQSQGTIELLTHKSWLADYSSLSSSVKECLKDVVSSHAGMKCSGIYDNTGYLAREADMNMNANSEIVREGIAILKEFKSTSIRSAV